MPAEDRRADAAPPVVVAPDPALRAAKKQLRRAAWKRRRENAATRTDAARAALAAHIADHGLSLVRSLVPAPARLCTYESWPAEPPTTALNAALIGAGYELLVPITLPGLDLDWRPMDSPDDTASGLGHDVLADVALVLAPATLVDGSGTRLGQGGGCYDRTLPRLTPGTPVVAVVFDDELVAEQLPRDAHDQTVDAVLRPSGVTRLR